MAVIGGNRARETRLGAQQIKIDEELSLRLPRWNLSRRDRTRPTLQSILSSPTSQRWPNSLCEFILQEALVRPFSRDRHHSRIYGFRLLERLTCLPPILERPTSS